MNVLLVNGSAKPQGNTAFALSKVAEALEQDGIGAEMFQLGGGSYRDCIGCLQCRKLDGRCVFDDDAVNRFIERAEQADAFVFGTPVYYAHPSGRILSVLDRAFYANRPAFNHKPGASVAVARRAGTCSSFDVLNKYFAICEMPIVSSTYWNGAFGRVPGDAQSDTEGIATLHNLGHNMAWILKCIEVGRAQGIDAPVAEHSMMNFIR